MPLPLVVLLLAGNDPGMLGPEDAAGADPNPKKPPVAGRAPADTFESPPEGASFSLLLLFWPP